MNGDQRVSQPTEPVLQAAAPAAWRRWLGWLARRGRARLAGLGLVLTLGLGLGAASILLFGLLAEIVRHHHFEDVDQWFLVLLRSHPGPPLRDAALAISLLGSEVLTVAFLLALAWLLWSRRYGAAVSLVLVVIGSQVLNNVLKLQFERPRPTPIPTFLPPQVWSFPSGHAMNSLAFYGFMAYLGWRLLAGPWRGLCLAAAAVLVGLIGLSRIYLEVHYLTDVLAGYVAGFVWLDSVILGGHLLSRFRLARVPPLLSNLGEKTIDDGP
jgi:undecaprenyl-diphosphatase